MTCRRRERGIGLGPVKGKDWATTFGPVFVTADELPTPNGEKAPKLGMRASVNGRSYSDGNLSELYWSFGEMISYASRGTEVRAGDIIGSGTVGTGCIADLSARHSLRGVPLAQGRRPAAPRGRPPRLDRLRPDPRRGRHPTASTPRFLTFPSPATKLTERPTHVDNSLKPEVFTAEEIRRYQDDINSVRAPGAYEPGRWSVSPLNRDPDVVGTMPAKVRLRDITLRAVESMPGVVMTADSKRAFLLQLVRAGVTEIVTAPARSRTIDDSARRHRAGQGRRSRRAHHLPADLPPARPGETGSGRL